MNPEIIDKILPVVGTLLGATIGACVTIIVTKINKQSEEKRHVRELLFNAGLQDWKHALEIGHKKGGKIYPLECYLFHMKLVMENIFDKNLNSNELKEAMKKIDKESLFYLKLVETRTENRNQT